MDLYRILKQAYNFGRDNGSGRSEKNLNDFIEKPEIKQLLIQSVSQRSELLISFREWFLKTHHWSEPFYEKDIDDFIRNK